MAPPRAPAVTMVKMASAMPSESSSPFSGSDACSGCEPGPPEDTKRRCVKLRGNATPRRKDAGMTVCTHLDQVESSSRPRRRRLRGVPEDRRAAGSTCACARPAARSAAATLAEPARDASTPARPGIRSSARSSPARTGPGASSTRSPSSSRASDAHQVVAHAITCYPCARERTRGAAMKLEGLHHITMITGDAQRNVDFYADVLGLRLVKKTVNFDAPDAYHLYFGDEAGSPGSILTWFEFAGARHGPRGRGDDPHDPARRRLRGGAGLLGRAARRRAATTASAATASLRFADYDGLRSSSWSPDDGNPPLRAEHPEVPAEHAILGVEGARAYAARTRRGPRAADRDARLHRGRRRRVPPRRRASATSTGRYDAATDERASRAPAPSTTSRGTRATTTTLAWQRARRGRRHARHAGASTATTSDSIYFRQPQRHPVRDRHDLARLRRRRGPGAPRRGAAPARASTSTCARSSSSCCSPSSTRAPRSARRRGHERPDLPRAPGRRRPGRPARPPPRPRRRRARPARPRRRPRPASGACTWSRRARR